MIAVSYHSVSNMPLTLDSFISDFAAAIGRTDAKRPVACNARSGAPYQCGIGPHTESATTDLVLAEMKTDWPERYSRVVREVCYPGNTRQRCDLCIGEDPAWDWCIEVKMLRLMGDNGKPNDNMLMHILSPYPADRSALTDCEKLAVSGLQGRKAIVLFAYEYPNYLCEPAVRAFELLASNRAVLGQRITIPFDGPHSSCSRAGYVYGWEISAG